MPQYGLEFSDNFTVWYVSLRSMTDRHSHLELPKTAKTSLIKRKANVNVCNLLFKKLKSIKIPFPLEFFLAISIMVEENGDMSF